MKRILLVGILVLTGCSGPSTGKVVDRRYNAPWTESSTSCEQRDTKGTCKSWDTDAIQHPESCELRLRDDSNEGWIEIPCTEYGEYKIGDNYPEQRYS